MTNKPVHIFWISNDPNDMTRYQRLKVARACDVCRQRKSKCDLGVPGSGVCSTCYRIGASCTFSGYPAGPKPLLKTPPPAAAAAPPAATGTTTAAATTLTVPPAHIDCDPIPHVPLETTIIHDDPSAPCWHHMPISSSLLHLEVELFACYFDYIGPVLYPGMVCRHDLPATPPCLRLAVLALASIMTLPHLPWLACCYAEQASCIIHHHGEGVGLLAASQTLLLLSHYSRIATLQI